jgi:hypothetical protein
MLVPVVGKNDRPRDRETIQPGQARPWIDCRYQSSYLIAAIRIGRALEAGQAARRLRRDCRSAGNMVEAVVRKQA